MTYIYWRYISRTRFTFRILSSCYFFRSNRLQLTRLCYFYLYSDFSRSLRARFVC